MLRIHRGVLLASLAAEPELLVVGMEASEIAEAWTTYTSRPRQRGNPSSEI